MKPEVGKYFFGRHYGGWCVRVYDYVSEDGIYASGKFVKDCYTAKEAMDEVYALNGWGTPKYYPAFVLANK